jgi:hypothetical protein
MSNVVLGKNGLGHLPMTSKALCCPCSLCTGEMFPICIHKSTGPSTKPMLISDGMKVTMYVSSKTHLRIDLRSTESRAARVFLSRLASEDKRGLMR